MASDEKKAKAIFQPYLRRRLLNLKDPHWLLDVSGEEAHLEIRVATLNSRDIMRSLRLVGEILNTLMVLDSY